MEVSIIYRSGQVAYSNLWRWLSTPDQSKPAEKRLAFALENDTSRRAKREAEPACILLEARAGVGARKEPPTLVTPGRNLDHKEGSRVNK